MPTERRSGASQPRPGPTQHRPGTIGGRSDAPAGSGRRLAWRPDPPPPQKPDLRDQLALRIGWVRFWLRALTLGFGIALIGASLALWPQLRGPGPYIFFLGLCLVPIGGLFTLLSWVLPLPHEHTVQCPNCGAATRVLSFPRPLPYTCRNCHSTGVIERGRITMESRQRG